MFLFLPLFAKPTQKVFQTFSLRALCYYRFFKDEEGGKESRRLPATYAAAIANYEFPEPVIRPRSETISLASCCELLFSSLLSTSN